jgi:trans-aconitate methyltransferase
MSASPSVHGWNPSLYSTRASFVHRLGGDVLDLLAPQAAERVLDVGCGTGELTALIAAAGAITTGLDASAAMIDVARARVPASTFVVGDAQALDYEGSFDAIFSNAALHWMPRAADVARGVARALVPGGRFVAELGGYGCIANARAAIGSALASRGIAPDEVLSWYFPTLPEYVAVLASSGLTVTFAHTFDRPTALEGDDGLRVWMATFLPGLEPMLGARWGGFVEDVEDAAAPKLLRDGRWVLDYVRLRVVARRPA